MCRNSPDGTGNSNCSMIAQKLLSYGIFENSRI